MNEKTQMNVILHKYFTLRTRIEIAKENHNADELEVLHKDYEKWNNLLEELATKRNPSMVYIFNAYYLENKAPKTIASELNCCLGNVNNELTRLRKYLLETGLWKQLL